jgi:hypothetical protein
MYKAMTDKKGENRELTDDEIDVVAGGSDKFVYVSPEEFASLDYYPL